MSQLLLNLRHVPEDEADEVRALLEGNAIAWYETEPNRWGISAGAIWIREDGQFERARALMDEYQAQRGAAARQAWAAARREGTARTFWAQLRHSPLRVLLILIGIILCAALSLWPLLLAAW
ncbi:DUF6164 family protein [Dokdonella immobilis]|uniref:Signal transducing protein n=1 Tax=Dokdonella immobilis TaxID=578942 RepID=A0A1I4V2Q3_9GAMM|nr:DUF6164 family protein [Dokdonella immobilis]SFM95534.1 hypothetical protein SAMN05216289_10164 [Dokdonella immobilis]